MHKPGVATRISVFGVAGDELPAEVAGAVADASLVVGAGRLLASIDPTSTRSVALNGDIASALNEIAGATGPVCVLASGDPGFFGIIRALGERFGTDALDVHPAPSSVSIAFARLALPWDDAVVVSAHGRPLEEAARRVAVAPKAAVLTSPDSPPEALGRELLVRKATHPRVVVCSRMGTEAETVTETDLARLSTGQWDPHSVVVLLGADPVAAEPTLSWGLPEETFSHRDGMVTKAEVRAVALGKLGLPPVGVMWDVGCGSGSVAIEAARLAPGLQVFAVDCDPSQTDRTRANADAHGASLSVTEGSAPEALADLPDPDRAFVGGGGLDVLDAVLARLRPGGRMVATYSAIDRAAAAYQRLGHLVEVSISRGRPLPDGEVRLEARNPVFVVWGPEE